MFRFSSRLYWLFTGLALLVASAGSPSAARAVTLKIMPLGDSITAGYGSPDTSGYRGPLYDELVAAGYNSQFVGSSTIFPGTLPANQQNNEGWAGFLIQSSATVAAPTESPIISIPGWGLREPTPISSS